MTGPEFNLAALKAAEQQVRLVMMSGAVTLSQIDRFAPGMTRAVVGAYLIELKSQQPWLEDGA